MRQRRSALISGVALILATLVSWTAAQAQAPTLLEQLNAQYKLVKIGNATGDLTILEPGTVLAIQKGGIVSVLPTSLAMCPSKFEDGNLKGPSGLCLAMIGKQNTRYLTVGEKVYPLKLEVNPGKEKISFAIIECDSCNGVTQRSFHKSEVIFQFGKGYLETANAAQVEDTIGQVLSISSGDDTQQGQAAQPSQQQAAQVPTASQAEPQSIQLGQTSDEVKAALGQPDKTVNLGVKQIWVYRDLKVTFLNGKVSDVQ